MTIKQWAICDATTGEVWRLEMAAAAPQAAGAVAHEVNPPREAWPQAPGPGRTLLWQAGTFAWRDNRTLQQAQAGRWEEVKTERDARMGGTFTAVGHTFQIDLVMIPGSALSAKVALDNNTPWSKQWTLANDTRVTLTAAQMIEVGQAMDATVDAIWNTSQDLRDAIYAADDLETVDAVTWPMG